MFHFFLIILVSCSDEGLFTVLFFMADVFFTVYENALNTVCVICEFYRCSTACVVTCSASYLLTFSMLMFWLLVAESSYWQFFYKCSCFTFSSAWLAIVRRTLNVFLTLSQGTMSKELQGGSIKVSIQTSIRVAVEVIQLSVIIFCYYMWSLLHLVILGLVYYLLSVIM